MKISGRVHCFFEQSGTFKNEFIKLGYQAEDYDIQNNFGQTDHVVDLFKNIESAYDGKPSLFDDITKDDLIMAFFPCIYFEAMQANYYSLNANNVRNLSQCDKIDVAIKRSQSRNYFHTILYKLLWVVNKDRSRLIIENPATLPHYLLSMPNFPKPTFIDRDRTLRGDYFIKPTAYWYINCEPTFGLTLQKDKKKKTINHCRPGANSGICSEERSMISPDYARNFICDFILGKEQLYTQLELFK